MARTSKASLNAQGGSAFTRALTSLGHHVVDAPKGTAGDLVVTVDGIEVVVDIEAASVVNPATVERLLAAAAGLSIGGEELGFGASVITIGAFTALASISVAAPVLAHAIWGARVLGPLGRAKEWLEANNAVVMAVVFIVLGTLLVVKGFSAL